MSSPDDEVGAAPRGIATPVLPTAITALAVVAAVLLIACAMQVAACAAISMP